MKQLEEDSGLSCPDCLQLKVDGMTKKVSGKKSAGFSLISEERFIELYQAMVRFQLLEEAIVSNRGRANKFKQQAALAAGVLLHLRDHDRVILGEQRHGHRLLKGERLESLLRNSPHRNSPHNARTGLITLDEKSSGAEQLMLAAGVALALKSASKNTATILFIEGNQTAGREWESALKFVVKEQLGLVIICTGAALNSHGMVRIALKLAADEPASRISIKGLPPSLQVDGNDCVAVYRVVQEALTHAREGSRPTVIRALGAKDILIGHGQKPAAPIARMEDYLRSKALFTTKLQKRTRSEFIAKLRAARAR
jgi:TPP-dependent pyruvate/acetoin dehydrogenase alpha subunit